MKEGTLFRDIIINYFRTPEHLRGYLRGWSVFCSAAWMQQEKIRPYNCQFAATDTWIRWRVSCIQVIYGVFNRYLIDSFECKHTSQRKFFSCILVKIDICVEMAWFRDTDSALTGLFRNIPVKFVRLNSDN